ncbi:MAG: twin-arginine translocation signal domain-containing protein, partial [Candidatus Competibacterales bacterium]
MSTGKYNRRDFIKLSAGAAGVTAASATVSYLGAQPSSERIIERVAANTDIACGPLGLIQRADGNSFVVNGKTYPFKDPNTGELRYHEPIRHRAPPHQPPQHPTPRLDFCG